MKLRSKTETLGRFVIFRMDDQYKEIFIDYESTLEDTFDDFYARIKASIDEKKGRYAVYDVLEEGKEESANPGVTGSLVLLTCAPDSIKVKEKMLYASSKEALKTALEGIKGNIHISDLTDLELGNIRETLKKLKSTV